MDARPSNSKRRQGYDSHGNDPPKKSRRDQVTGSNDTINSGAGCSSWTQPSDSGYETMFHESTQELSQISVTDKRRSQSRSQSGRKSYDPSLPWAGVVQKIYLKNFMCHSLLEIKLNPRVNFIVGRNGSGKSAILNAMVLGLGGSACATNRGSSLKEFIKTGMSSATIEITLNNCGCRAYKPEVFGDKIIVTRKITENGSSYLIKGSKGDVIYTKREELQKILTYMNVQVDNPISVLNQDTARSFLNATNIHEKYHLYMRATRLKVLWEIAFDTIETQRKAMLILRAKKAALEVTKKELDSLELRWNQVKAVQGYRRKIISLRSELNWAIAIVEESNLKALQKKKAEQESLLPALQLAITNQAAEEKRLKEQLLNVEKSINDLREEAASYEQTHREAKNKVTQCKDAYSRKVTLCKVSNAKTQRHQKNITSLREEIAKLQDETGSCAEKREQLRQQIATRENKLQEMTATQKTVDHQLAQLRGNENKYRDDFEQNKAELSECNRRVNKLQEHISSMQNSSSDRLAVYGRHMPVLVQRIKEAHRQGKFKRMPVGPIGAYIEVKDKAWAPAIESFLGGNLRNFCVDNVGDQKVLFAIFQSVFGNQTKPSIITSQFLTQVHDVREYAVHAPDGMSSMLDALIISNPIIANCLIDQREIETILLIPTSNEAVPLMRSQHLVPHNCKRSITMQGDEFFPDPNYRTYAGEVNASAQYLQVNMADLVQSKQNELATYEQRKNLLKAEEKRISEALKENNSNTTQLRKEKNRLERSLLEIKAEIRTLKDSEEPESMSIATLLAEVDESMIQLQAAEEEENNLLNEAQFLKTEWENAKAEIVVLRERVQELQARERPLLEELEQIQDEMRELTAGKGSRARKLLDVQENVRKASEQVDNQQQVTDQAVYLASQIHPERLESRKSAVKLDDEIKALEKIIESVERDTGDFVSVKTDLNEKKGRYEEVSSMVQVVEGVLNLLDKTLKNRIKLYTRIQNLTTDNVNAGFAFILNTIGFSGQVRIDHAKQELVIEVQPGHRLSSDDTKTLSGGERSYSTVVFIMSLWNVVSPPFYFLDEFDVFMDKANRRRTLDMLTQQAKSRRNCQFVFLTPQDLSTVEAETNVAIHRMGNPREEK